jgi:CDP-glucose 4,6-dehydratase
LEETIKRIKPDFIFHLAAQPLVRESYSSPKETFDVNVTGTVNLLESVRKVFLSDDSRVLKKCSCSVVCVTTDKCYENNNSGHPFVETDSLGGSDPYSASKGACEIVISSYRRSFFSHKGSNVRVASARAGNVIGGGDWAKDRIVPDAMRAFLSKKSLVVRNKMSTRPWQHVLEPLGGYLTLGAALATRKRFNDFASGFNFGPDPKANRTVKELIEEILKWTNGKWVDKSDPKAVHEAGLLNLDIRKARRILGWKPKWKFEKTIEETVRWYVAVGNGEKPLVATQRQIMEYSI